MRTTTTTDAFLRALAHSKSVETQTLLLDEMLRSLISETESLDDDDDDEDRAWFLDLRPREKYQKHSLSRSVNIPFDEISGSFHLLPPRETPFSVFVEEGRETTTKRVWCRRLRTNEKLFREEISKAFSGTLNTLSSTTSILSTR